MRVTRIKLKNFGKHKTFEENTDSPIVGLMGENGAGKSCILKALSYAYTGELPDTGKSWIHDGEKSATVEVDFTINGKQGKIVRKITPSASSRLLTWDGEEYKKAKEVDHVLESIFVSDKKAVGNAAFIEQGELDKILFGSESERMELFIKLLNLSFCEKHANVLDGKIKKLNTGINDYSDIIANYVADLEEKGKEKGIAVAEFEESKHWLEHKEQINKLVLIMEHLNKSSDNIATQKIKLVELQTEFDALPVTDEPTVKKYEEKAERLVKEATDAVDQYNRFILHEKDCKARNDLEAELKALPPVSEKTVESLEVTKQQLLAQIKGTEDALEASNELQVLQTHMIELQKVPATFSGMKYTEAEVMKMTEECTALSNELNQMQNWLGVQTEIFENKEGTGTCFKCGLKLSSKNVFTKDSLEATEAIIESKITTLQGLKEVERDARFHREQYGMSMKAWKEDLDINIKSTKAIMTAFPDCQNSSLLANQLPALKEELELLEKLKTETAINEADRSRVTKALSILPAINSSELFLITTRQQVEIAKVGGDASTKLAVKKKEIFNALQLKRTELDSKKTALTDMETALKESQDQQEEIIDVLLDNKHIADLADKTNIWNKITEVQSFVGAQAEATEARKNEITVLEKLIEELHTQLEDVQDRQKNDLSKLKIINELQLVKSVLKKDGLPAAVVKANFLQLAEITQECLSYMDADFNIFINEEKTNSFLFERLDLTESCKLDQSKMSGGQRVRLAVAFLMAVQQLLIPDFDFLVLDEPSQHLDEKARNSLADLLLKMNENLQNTDQQMWVCDHSVELERSFTKIIKLT